MAGNSSTEQPPLKDKSLWSDQEKKIQKIDRLVRSLLIQGLSNDIYSLIDTNKIVKDLWDALARHMLGSKYGEQDRKAAVLYEYKTFKAIKEELLLDTYIRYLQVINDLKKCGYSKDNCELNFKFLNNLQPWWKQYATMMRQNKNLMDINIDALCNILKQNQGDVNDAMRLKKKTVVVNSDPLALIAEKTKVSKRKDKVVVSSDSKGSDADDFSELKKITTLLAKAFNRKKFYAKPTNNNLRTSSASNSANKKQEYVKSNDKKEDKSVEEKKRDMSKVKCYNCKKEGCSKHMTGNRALSTNFVGKFLETVRFGNNDFAMIAGYGDVVIGSMKIKRVSKEKVVVSSDSEGSEFDDFNYKKAKVKDYEYYKTKMLLAKKDKDEQVFLAKDQAWMESSSDSNQEINANMVFMAQIEKFFLIQRLAHRLLMKRFSRKQIANQQVLFDKISVQMVKLDKHVRDLKNTVLEKDFKISELEEWYTLMFLTHSDKALEIKKFTRSRENKIEFAYDYGNLNAGYVNEKINLEDDYFQEIINPDFDNIDSLFQQTSSLKPYVLVSNLKKNVKRYSRKDLKACNNSHLGETSSAYMCNDAMNVSCDSRMNDLLDDNNFFIFDDVNVRISPVSKMLFRKKPHDSINVCSKSNSNKSLPRTVHKWLSKLQPLAEPVAKWFPRVMRQIDKIYKTPNSSRPIYKWQMMGNRAHLMNFVEKFLGTVRFSNNDFVVIAGYGDVVIGSTTIKKVYYVEGLGHNLFSVGQFYDKGLEVTFRKSTCFVRNEDGVDLLTGDRSSNLYTIALNEVASNSSTCLLAKASFSCYLLNDYEDVGKLKAKGDIRVFVGYSKESATFKVYNKRT
nr:integrase, catalytic region, zinc finger, CCHC-type, peptidase aspartic, catalytic [Tanacetum cinerariifolium]